MYYKINDINAVETCHGTSLLGRLYKHSRYQDVILMSLHNSFPKNVRLRHELYRLSSEYTQEYLPLTKEEVVAGENALEWNK